jgi:hypothetical protein
MQGVFGRTRKRQKYDEPQPMGWGSHEIHVTD